MKHKCAVNGCANRGVWIRSEAYGVYCEAHRALLEETNHQHFLCHRRPVLGQVHEGRKIGKPRSWRDARRMKEAD